MLFYVQLLCLHVQNKIQILFYGQKYRLIIIQTLTKQFSFSNPSLQMHLLKYHGMIMEIDNIFTNLKEKIFQLLFGKIRNSPY